MLSPGLGNNFIFNENDINDLNKPFKVLKKRLASLGYDIITSDDNSVIDCSWILFIDSPFKLRGWLGIKTNLKNILKGNRPKTKLRNLYQEALNANLADKMVLFLWEPPSVKPQNYSPFVYNKFKYIFTWNDSLIDNNKFFKFFLPSPQCELLSKKIPFSDKKLLVNMSANKHSPAKNEMFSFRRKSIKYFENNYPNDFDLYGPKWNKPYNSWQKIFPWLMEKFSTHRGLSYDKKETISNYRFSLCYENIASEPGFITEKIFDCLTAKTVPIYLGATNIENYVDASAFIDRRKFKTNKDLAKFITSIKENEYNQYLQAGEKYLSKEKYKLFKPENFANTIINTLNLKNI